jgi:cytidine deaminase
MKLLNLAAEIAYKSIPSKKDFLLACVVKRADGAITYSVNEHTREPSPGGHAEARATGKADWGSTFYVARVTRDGQWAMSRPCKKCQAIIRNRGIAKVYYTIGPGEWGTWHPQEQKHPI